MWFKRRRNEFGCPMCGYQEDFIDRARDLLEVARKAVNE